MGEIMFLLLGETVASRAVFVMVSGSDGPMGGNAFGARKITQKRQ